MIPSGETSCGEINIDGHGYVMCFIAENAPEQISVFVTDCEVLYKGCLTTQQLSPIDQEFKTFTQKGRFNLFRNAIRQKKITFSRLHSKLTVFISSTNKSEAVDITLNEINTEQRAGYIKELFFHIVRGISEREEQTSPEKHLPSTTIRMNTKAKSVKQKLHGTSIVNPGTKRICFGSGVKYEDN